MEMFALGRGGSPPMRHECVTSAPVAPIINSVSTDRNPRFSLTLYPEVSGPCAAVLTCPLSETAPLFAPRF
jgi:hypothetical protein